MKAIRKLTLVLMISVQVFSITTMAQDIKQNDLASISEITGKVRYGLRGNNLEGAIKLSGNVTAEKGDYFELGFENAKGQSASEVLQFEKLPILKIVYKGKTLVENEDFVITLKDEKVEVHFNTEIKGQVQITIDDVQLINRRTDERVYYLILEEHFKGENEKINVQPVTIDYGYSNFGGRVTFRAGHDDCEMDGIKYEMKGTAYIDETTHQMMVPLKDVLKVLGTKEDHMKYSKGIFKAYIIGCYTFTANSNKVETSVTAGSRKIELLQPIIIKKGNLYIGLEDLANVVNGEIEKSAEGNCEINELYIPVRSWQED